MSIIHATHVYTSTSVHHIHVQTRAINLHFNETAERNLQKQKLETSTTNAIP